jgi:hypothetical protein
MNLRRRSYLGESDILSGKVWASSGDLEWIKKAISEFYYGSTITLTPISEKEWSVSNSKRVIDKVQVIKKGKRFYFKNKED